VIPVDALPPPDAAGRADLLRRLTAAPPGQEAWECGGISNFAIAASRLGLRTGAVGHLGGDVYGEYMERVLMVRLGRGGVAFGITVCEGRPMRRRSLFAAGCARGLVAVKWQRTPELFPALSLLPHASPIHD
jgi:sugar/nucleoside kinase (ribokinase family)